MSKKIIPQHWNRRRFLGAAAGSLATLPIVARAEEEDLPDCTREARHGPWQIKANAGYYRIARDIDAHGADDVDILTYSSDDGSVTPPSPRIRVTDRGDRVDVSALVPKHIEKSDGEYRFGPAGERGRMHIWRQSDQKAYYVQALLLVDGRTIADGFPETSSTNLLQMIRVGMNWSANPLPAMRAGREAVLLLRHGYRDKVGDEIMRLPIDLDGVTAASRRGAALRNEAGRELEARECSNSGCYLTTACCEHLGRPDNCWELETLRWYRDRILALETDGPAALATYYRVAPAIVAALPAGGFGRTWALARIYWSTVVPCALLVRLGGYRLARVWYERTFRRLRARWLPA